MDLNEMHEQVEKMRETDALPTTGSVANLLGINRPISWLDKHVFPHCNEVWDTHEETFNRLITNMFYGEGYGEVAELLQAIGKAGIIWSIARNLYMLGYSKALDEVQRDRAILDKLEEK